MLTALSAFMTLLAGALGVWSRMKMKQAGILKAEVAMLKKQVADLERQLLAEAETPHDPKELADEIRKNGL